ncbi:MAG: hypothetical protein HY912_08355, partial [Desulfomonile tiedjei]|nr:hypothetical protein [Desulfomonile tiedjei]
LEAIRTGELARVNGKLSRLSPEDRETVEVITRSIINKIAHDPIVYLKKAGAKSRSNLYLDTAQKLFGLDRISGDQDNSEEESIDD